MNEETKRRTDDRELALIVESRRLMESAICLAMVTSLLPAEVRPAEPKDTPQS